MHRKQSVGILSQIINLQESVTVTLLFVLTGDHLCEISTEMYGSGSAASGAELSSHRHPQSHDSRRTSLQIPAVQGIY